MINNVLKKVRFFNSRKDSEIKKAKFDLQQEPNQDLKNVFEPVQVEVPTTRISSEKFGYIGRGALPYYFNYQSLHFNGKGRVVCVCRGVEELTFEKYCDGNLKLTCSKSNDTYITTFFVDGVVVWSCRNDPSDITVNYESTLVCEKIISVMVDH